MAAIDAASRTLAVLTSGGDAPGMNAAVRAVARTALERGARVYAICEGYAGLVEGGRRIQPMMGAIATGASWVLIPESPPDVDDWESTMCARLRTGREAGRRDSIVIVAEGARDRHGNPITTEHVRRSLHERLGEDVRITILGHVQRGGAPSSFDRMLATRFASECVDYLLREAASSSEPHAAFIGLREGKTQITPLEDLPRLMDLANERPRDQWWRALAPIARLLAQTGPGAA